MMTCVSNSNCFLPKLLPVRSVAQAVTRPTIMATKAARNTSSRNIRLVRRPVALRKQLADKAPRESASRIGRRSRDTDEDDTSSSHCDEDAGCYSESEEETSNSDELSEGPDWPGVEYDSDGGCWCGSDSGEGYFSNDAVIHILAVIASKYSHVKLTSFMWRLCRCQQNLANAGSGGLDSAVR